MDRAYLSTGLALVFGLVVATAATGFERMRNAEAGAEPSLDSIEVADPCEADGPANALVVGLVATGEVLDALGVWVPPAGGAVRVNPAPSASRRPIERCPPART